MKDKTATLMKLRFASQWMEMIRHNGCMGDWRLKIKNGQIHNSITSPTIVGYWSETPQGYTYWRNRTAELDNALNI